MRSALLVALIACGGGSRQLTTVPVGLILEGEADAPTVHLSLEDAMTRRAELRADDPPPGIQAGERAWFFRAYDDDDLVFVEGRYAPYDEPRPLKRAGRYRIERRVVVPRSERALDALGVRAQIEQHEGVCGIQVGMTTTEVRERLGTPTLVSYPQAAGCVNEQYSALDVTSCHGLVTRILGDRCPR